MRFKVSSMASNVVIGVALIPGVALLAGTFTFFEDGNLLVGAAMAVGFVGLMIGAGLVAKRLSRDIEISDTSLREVKRDGRVTEIRWDEPHELRSETTVIRRGGIPIGGNTTFSVGAPDGRTIAFAAIAKAGMAAVAAKVGQGRELLDGHDGIGRAVELSTATQLPLARARITAGERVQFGAIGVSAQGVHVSDRIVPLAGASLEYEPGLTGRSHWLVRGADGKPARVRAKDVPNAAVLQALIAT